MGVRRLPKRKQVRLCSRIKLRTKLKRTWCFRTRGTRFCLTRKASTRWATNKCSSHSVNKWAWMINRWWSSQIITTQIMSTLDKTTKIELSINNMINEKTRQVSSNIIIQKNNKMKPMICITRLTAMCSMETIRGESNSTSRITTMIKTKTKKLWLSSRKISEEEVNWGVRWEFTSKIRAKPMTRGPHRRPCPKWPILSRRSTTEISTPFHNTPMATRPMLLSEKPLSCQKMIIKWIFVTEEKKEKIVKIPCKECFTRQDLYRKLRAKIRKTTLLKVTLMIDYPHRLKNRQTLLRWLTCQMTSMDIGCVEVEKLDNTIMEEQILTHRQALWAATIWRELLRGRTRITTSSRNRVRVQFKETPRNDPKISCSSPKNSLPILRSEKNMELLGVDLWMFPKVWLPKIWPI